MNIISRLFQKKDKSSNDLLHVVMPRFSRPRGWQPKIFILQKDLPNVKKGARFQQTYQSDKVYFHGIAISSQISEKDQVGIIEFEAKDVENSKWFALLNGA